MTDEPYSTKLAREVHELGVFQEDCSKKGVYATHLLLYNPLTDSEIPFITRVGEKSKDEFYMMHGFDRHPAHTHEEIEENARSAGATLVSLGEPGIEIEGENSFEILDGEIFMSDSRSTVKRSVESFLR